VCESPGDPPDLADRLRAGDPAAFEDLVRRYQHRVFAVALRMLGSRADAEDLAQDVFVRVHRSVGGFRGDAKLSTWLYAITARLCLTRLGAAERKAPRASDEVLERLADEGPDPTAAAERRQLELALHEAIARLPEDRRLLVVLRDLEGLAYEEIAEALGMEVGTVKSRLHRARLELKDRLEKHLG
jgi:RNA polymerase sigma-70 factor (ECF subfamily)